MVYNESILEMEWKKYQSNLILYILCYTYFALKCIGKGVFLRCGESANFILWNSISSIANVLLFCGKNFSCCFVFFVSTNSSLQRKNGILQAGLKRSLIYQPIHVSPCRTDHPPYLSPSLALRLIRSYEDQFV